MNVSAIGMNQSEGEIASDLSQIISDYQLGIRNKRTPEDVLGFVNQVNVICDWMTSSDRLDFLKGLRTALTNSYWSANRIKMYLKPLLQMSGIEHNEEWILLSLQEYESSQSRLVREVDSRSGILVSPRIIESHDLYIYVDDASYTGRTLAKYLFKVAEELAVMSKKSRKLVVWHLTEYSGETHSRLVECLKLLKDLKVDVVFERVEDLGNKAGDKRKLGTLQPSSECASSPIVQRYLKSRPTLVAMMRNPNLWRDPNAAFIDGLFATREERHVVEKALLEVGCYLYLRTEQPKFRPLGYFASPKDVSFGFGSMFCTCHNSANTTPVAMWWGDPNRPKNNPLSLWNPLLPRIV